MKFVILSALAGLMLALFAHRALVDVVVVRFPPSGQGLGAFNMSQCPHWREPRSDNVARHVDMNKFVGTYYEQAVNDYTEYPLCPSLSCIRSVKEWTDVNGGKFQMRDHFQLSCFGTPYPVAYYWNTTKDPGHMKGFLDNPPWYWRMFFGNQVYEETIVEVKDDGGEQYEWVIEFQCTENKDSLGRPTSVKYAAINFYSREQHVSKATLVEMLQAGRDAGLGIYMDQWPGLSIIKQEGCSYEPVAGTL
mmetsp:Transcript_21482/g.64268  ORF Transcript_21482/g.64268 Transcript_21482/m.64268 type:complete len:248 (+) Transcript_21482:1466-2209(+)